MRTRSELRELYGDELRLESRYEMNISKTTRDRSIPAWKTDGQRYCENCGQELAAGEGQAILCRDVCPTDRGDEVRE